MPSFVLGLLVGLSIAVILVVMMKRRRNQSSVPARSRIRSSTARRDETAALMQNLRVKVLWDDAVAQRLVDHERSLNPTASEREHIQAAIERWERDNR